MTEATDRAAIYQTNLSPNEVARQIAWQLRKSHSSPLPAFWLPLILLSCSAALQLISLVALFMKTI